MSLAEPATARLAESGHVPGVSVALVLGGAGAAWVAVITRMSGMDAGPGGDPGAPGWFAVWWAVMTAAMMLPASAPAVARLARPRRSPAPPASAAALVFCAGYVAVWMVAGLAGYGLVQAARAPHAAVLGWSQGGRYLAAAAVIGAGLYQLTGAKKRWLARCTAPHLPRPADDIAGALRAGVAHGGCCVACCWTLMAALYALGLMSPVWMAVMTALIAGERVLACRAAVRAVAGVLFVLGIAVAAAPATVPALTIPPAPHAATTGMGMGGGAMG